MELSTKLREVLQEAGYRSRVAFLFTNGAYWTLTEQTGNFLHLEDDGTISYLPAKKVAELGFKDGFQATGRVRGKPGRIIRKFILPEFPHAMYFPGDREYGARTHLEDKDWEEFANLIKGSVIAGNLRFEMVQGEDIRKWYLVDNYGWTSRVLSQSCMRYAECQAFFDIYVNNPQVSMFVALDDDDKLHGRCLVWDTDMGKVRDRIYASDALSTRMDMLLTEQGIQSEVRDAVVTLDDADFRFYPYMDTFKYLSVPKKKLTQYPLPESYKLEQTDGNYEETEDEGTYCAACDYLLGEVWWVEGYPYCEDCRDHLTCECGNTKRWDDAFCTTCEEKYTCPKCSELKNADDAYCTACDAQLWCDQCEEHRQFTSYGRVLECVHDTTKELVKA